MNDTKLKAGYLRQWVQLRKWLLSGRITVEEYDRFLSVLNNTYRSAA